MFGLFKKKSPIQKLQAEYSKLLEESYALSTSNRAESDLKMAEANEVLEKIKAIEEQEKQS